LQLTEQALAIGQGQDLHLELNALNNLALIYLSLGDSQRALRLYEQALSSIRGTGDRAKEAGTLNNLATVYQRTGRGRQALVIDEQILPIVRRVGNRIGEATVLNNMATAYCTLGQFEQALEILKQALVIERTLEDRARETVTLNLMAYVLSDMHRYPEALNCFEEAMKVEQQLDRPANVASDLVTIALLLYQHFDYAAGAIRRMEQAMAVLIEAELSQDSAGHTLQTLQHHLTDMRQRLPVGETLRGTLAMPPERVEQIIATTVTIMTKRPSQRDMWRETITNFSLQAQRMGKQVDLEFFSTILELLDGKVPILPADHPYAGAIAAIQDGIAKGRRASDDDDGNDAPEEVQACVAAQRSHDPQEKMAFMQQLVALQGQVPDDEMKALFQTIQLALFGGDLAHLGDHLTGLARQVWEMTVAGVQQDDTSPEMPPDGA
jgi:hypothetical protein